MLVSANDPEACFDFGRKVVEDHSLASSLIASFEKAFDEATPALPEKPDAAAAEQWLIELRTNVLKGGLV